MLVLQSSTFVSQREAAELWVILKSLHTDGMRGKESFKKMVKDKNKKLDRGSIWSSLQ